MRQKTLKNTLLTVSLCAVLLITPLFPAQAAHVSSGEAIAVLETLGLVRGTGSGFQPERSATRAEAAVMLLRLLGLEQAALTAEIQSPFLDAGWADPYLGYAVARNLVRGVSAQYYGSDTPVSARDYITMILRVLGYQEGTDFTWQDSIAFADRIGLTDGEYAAPDADFLREDMALVSYTALTMESAGRDTCLIERLYASGVVSAEALMQTRLASVVNMGKPVYTATEIYERSSSAVISTEAYDTLEDLEAQDSSGSGSGFFITHDGVAAMTYHQLEDCSYATATTTDGRTFAVSEVIFYDTQRDVAVVRLSDTDTEGNVVRNFPCLPIGNSDALRNGDPVYTVSNPLGLVDSISSGLISSRSRVVDDPDYPCIQLTAAISSGSSGGPLLNHHGEVVGLLYATYTRGQNLNLAVPVNCLQDVDFAAAGVPLSEVYRVEAEKKANAVLTVDEPDVTMHVGEVRDVIVRTDCPGQPNMRFWLEDSNIISCSWGDFQTRSAVPLHIRADSPGTTTVEITFADGYGNEEAVALLQVTVVGDEDENAAEESGGSAKTEENGMEDSGA